MNEAVSVSFLLLAPYSLRPFQSFPEAYHARRAQVGVIGKLVGRGRTKKNRVFPEGKTRF
jgi:hypothetical protein